MLAPAANGMRRGVNLDDAGGGRRRSSYRPRLSTQSTTLTNSVPESDRQLRVLRRNCVYLPETPDAGTFQPQGRNGLASRF
jgi:hypothetical protein